jgi:hypothetical protein
MYTKTLLLALSVAAFSSCSTTYKSGQTPDDVYYSPVRYSEVERDEEKQEVKQNQMTTTTLEDRDIRMCIRDRRWREFNSRYNDGYGYDYSPYRYADCSCNTQNYYYNQYYYPTPVYFGKVATPVSNVQRRVNLNAYNGYTPVVTNAKTGTSADGTNWANPPKKQYNNSNNKSGSSLGNLIRQVITPSSSNNTSNSSTPTDNNNTRTYNPPASSNSSNSGSSPAPAGSVSRPGRGGK